MGRAPNANCTVILCTSLFSSSVGEDAYGHVRVRGKGSELIRGSGDHGALPQGCGMLAICRLSTDDENAVLAGVMWKGSAAKLNFRPEEGLEVVCEGRLTTYPGQSKYQLVIEKMAPAGVGALMALLEERKKKLAAEGLFAEERKKAIPFLPEVIGVVTSPTGAVIRDIIHRVTDRFPRHILVWPVLVQGEGSAEQVARAIQGFNRFTPGGPVPRPDTLIVARGGGSIEDLWGFNEEIVVRAAAASDIPLISAVGHETDWTLIDLVADRRAPTPTGAAEMATPVRTELLAQVQGYGGRLVTGVRRGLERGIADWRAAARGLPRPEDLIGSRSQRLDAASAALRAGLKAASDAAAIRFQSTAARLRVEALKRDLEQKAQRVTDLEKRAAAALARTAGRDRQRLDGVAGRLSPRALKARCETGGERVVELAQRAHLGLERQLRTHARALEGASARLESVNPKGVLARGYALVRDENGAVVRSAEALKPGVRAQIELADGARDVVVDGAGAAGGKRAKAASGKQGALF